MLDMGLCKRLDVSMTDALQSCVRFQTCFCLGAKPHRHAMASTLCTLLVNCVPQQHVTLIPSAQKLPGKPAYSD